MKPLSDTTEESQSKRARTNLSGVFNLKFEREVANATNGVEFLSTWDSYKGYTGYFQILGAIEFVDVITWVTNATTHTEKSAFWLLAAAAAQGQPRGFLEAWEMYKGQISLGDLLKHGDKGILALLLLAARKGHPEALIKVLTHFKEKLNCDELDFFFDLVLKYLGDAQVPASNLDLLLWDLLSARLRVPNKMAQRGSETEAGIFARFAPLTVAGNDQPFLSAVDHFKLNCFNDPSWWSSYKDEIIKSVLLAFLNGHKKALDVLPDTPAWMPNIIYVISRNIRIDQLLPLLNKGDTELSKSQKIWLIRMVALVGTSEQLRQAQTRLNVSNAELLGELTWLLTFERSQPFVDFWSSYKDVFTAKDLEYKYVLWHLLYIAIDGFSQQSYFYQPRPRPEHFVMVANHLNMGEVLPDLIAKRIDDADPIYLWFLAAGLNGPQSEFFITLLDRVVLGPVPEAELDKEHRLYNENTTIRRLLNHHKLGHILDRITFFNKLESFKRSEIPPTPDEVKELHDLAGKGKCEKCFYELAHYLANTQYSPWEAFKKVSSQGPENQALCEMVAENLLAEAMGVDDMSLQYLVRQLVKRALNATLKIEKNGTRDGLLERIIKYYVFTRTHFHKEDPKPSQEGIEKEVEGAEKKVEGLEKKVEGAEKKVEGAEKKEEGIEKKEDDKTKDDKEKDIEVVAEIIKQITPDADLEFILHKLDRIKWKTSDENRLEEITRQRTLTWSRQISIVKSKPAPETIDKEASDKDKEQVEPSKEAVNAQGPS
ncbi:MAG: hypothetical protein ACHQJ6_01745 [Candidatus Berkiellales bacterium]